MASETEICNLALSHIGVGKEIANLETENTQEASACRRFYATARDEVLRAFSWPFATRILALALVEEAPNDEWAYSYRYPTDCLRFRRILSGIRNDSRQSRVPYRIVGDDEGSLVYTDIQTAEAEYTKRETDPERFQADFVMGLSFLLASYIASRLTAGDPFKMGERAKDEYNMKILQAQAAAANEEQAEEHPESEFIRFRE